MSETLENAMTGRSIKFTPERVAQIRNLLERGMSREQIAETIGSTVGSLQVTCSRLGISLRIPKGPVPMMMIEPGKGNGNSKPEISIKSVTLTLVISFNGRTKAVELPLSEREINHIAIQAAFRSISVAALIAEIITKTTDEQKEKESD